MLGELFEGCLEIDPTRRSAEALTQTDRPLPTCKGVVLFADGSDRSVAFLTAANIRRTAAARLFPQKTGGISKRADISPIVRRVYYECCYNDFASTLKYRHVCRTLYPDSWQKLITLAKPWFVRINLSAQWPNFSLTERPSVVDRQKIFGPFATRKSAATYITALRIAFSLCQRPDMVDSPSKAAACPYLQMQACPAPCVGRVGPADYLLRIHKALAAAGGQTARYADEIRAEMMRHAANEDYEAAGVLKKRLAALDSLNRDEYRWTGDVSKLAILHIDRWARISPPGKKRKSQSYAAYLIKDGRIVNCGTFLLDDFSGVYRTLRKYLEEPVGPIHADKLAETLAIAASFIYRSSPPGVWMDCPKGGRDEIMAAIRQRWNLDDSMAC